MRVIHRMGTEILLGKFGLLATTNQKLPAKALVFGFDP